MFLPFNSVSEWSVPEDPNPFTTTSATLDGPRLKYAERFKVAIFTANGTITAKKNINLNIICVGGGGGGANSDKNSNQDRYGGGGGGVVIVTRSMTKGTVYDVTVGSGGAGGLAGGNSSIKNVASGFIVQGDGGGGGTTSTQGAGGRGHPYSINSNNPVTGGSGSGYNNSNSDGNTKISTTTTASVGITQTVRPQFKDQNGLSISINTVVTTTVMEFNGSYIRYNYSGGGGWSRGRPNGPAPPGSDGQTGGTIYSTTGTAANGVTASGYGNGGGGAGANTTANYTGGSGAGGIVIVWVAY